MAANRNTNGDCTGVYCLQGLDDKGNCYTREALFFPQGAENQRQGNGCHHMGKKADAENQKQGEKADAENLKQVHAKAPLDLCMNDGVRRIDFVLVYQKDRDELEEGEKQIRREKFQENLEKEGLQLEISEIEYDQDEKTYFVKVHAPWNVLTRHAEFMNLKMPLAENDMSEKFESCWTRYHTPLVYDKDILPKIPDYFTAPFSRAREKQFIVKDKETFFSPAERSLLTHQILARAVFEDMGDTAKNKFGIKKMISSGFYLAAYPLHEGDYYIEKKACFPMRTDNLRLLLYETWARPGMWYKFQPLDHIRLYFGEKIGIYFAWLGYYTGLLIPAGLVGLAVFMYGWFGMPFNETSNEICDTDKAGNITMCPLCDQQCSYWKLEQSCMYARITHLFDNEATVAFAAFMALWSTFFHEMWKRRVAEIGYDWDVADFEEEETIRPEFEASVRERKVNPVSRLPLHKISFNQIEVFYGVIVMTVEPYLPITSRVLRIFSSLMVVVVMLCVVLAALCGVIVYRMTVSAMLYAVDKQYIQEGARIITSSTASLINLVIILFLETIYQSIAEFLTDFERCRTLTEWENSFTLKMFLFQFVNYYASLFYIAFIKGRVSGRPGNYNRDFIKRQEECNPAGCLIELCIQLAIIMIGKQTVNNFQELIYPKVMNYFKVKKVRERLEMHREKVARYEKDFMMESMPEVGLFPEYLEMVIQYGFVTIFVAAFPLAPLFALLNNIIEIRVDAYKFITQWRRPLALKAQDIGIWFDILQGISTVAIMSNAAIIAFTSEFIPKLVYRYAYNKDANNLKGYISFSLSLFNVSDFEPNSIPNDPKIEEFGIVTHCRYRDYRSPPTAAEPYKFTEQYWHILTARLAFIITFVLAVQSSVWLISYIVPDVPRAVKLQMLREKYLAKEAVLAAEYLRPGSMPTIPMTSYGVDEGVRQSYDESVRQIYDEGVRQRKTISECAVSLRSSDMETETSIV